MPLTETSWKTTLEAFDAWEKRTGDRVRVVKQGKQTKVMVPSPPIVMPCSKPKGSTTEFSRSARLRMLRWLARIDFLKAGGIMFLTLTYPNREKDVTRKDLNNHKRAFFRYMEKAMNQHLQAIWRIEWVVRKSGDDIGRTYPHLHIILMNVRRMFALELVNTAWKKAIGEEGYVRTDSQEMLSENMAGAYVAKYAAKCESSLVNGVNLNRPSGKDWGIHRRDELPLCEEFERYITKESLYFQAMQQAYQEVTSSKALTEYSFVLLGTVAEARVQEILLEKALDAKKASE